MSRVLKIALASDALAAPAASGLLSRYGGVAKDSALDCAVDAEPMVSCGPECGVVIDGLARNGATNQTLTTAFRSE